MHEFWFLTRLYKARLISFYLEENPSVLNAASDHYHSFYDKDGSRKYLTDDEGNRLKSVASSPELLGLCSSNDIESIYISLPVIEMFQMRGRIALITAIISFVLIFILLGTVTLTNKEEEELYAEVSEADSTDRLDHVIFNVILPSGRSVPTVTAAARWDNRRIPWKHKSPEQKLLFIVSVICGILLFTVFMSYLGVNKYYDENSIIRYIVGLGAQSLIKDIIAGIFIVFEGEFRVGDIVTIGTYRGTVMDIGLRTTKILGMDGNIKIYNNSEISGITNVLHHK